MVAPYGYAYALNRATLGERLESDIRLYSATMANYLATTSANVIHGDWSAPFGQSERFLFPGVLAIALAGFGLYAIDRRRVTIIALGVIGFVISLGLNTPFYELLRALVTRIADCVRRRARRSWCSWPLPRSGRTAGRA